MESINYIKKLEKISVDKKYEDLTSDEVLELVNKQNDSDWVLEAGIGFEVALQSLFDNRNVPDKLKEAYKLSYPGKSEEYNLIEHYMEKIEKGDESVTGFISGLKGKYFELELNDNLGNIYEGYKFKVFQKQNTPTVDIKGINEEGEEILIQAKMWGEDNWSKISKIMEENPNVLYATSSEIKNKILEELPELSEQFVPEIDYSNLEFTDKIGEELELLVRNMGIDVPDGLGDLIPHLKEIILGIFVIKELIYVNRDLKRVKMSEKSRIGAIKVLVLFARYGVTAVLVAIAGYAGGQINPVLTVPGGLTGAWFSRKINKEIMPYLNELLIGLLKMNSDDMFYYSNKKIIDFFSIRYKNQEIAQI